MITLNHGVVIHVIIMIQSFQHLTQLEIVLVSNYFDHNFQFLDSHSFSSTKTTIELA